MRPTPILEMARAYGLRPRLWLLVKMADVIILVDIFLLLLDKDSIICNFSTWIKTMLLFYNQTNWSVSLKITSLNWLFEVAYVNRSKNTANSYNLTNWRQVFIRASCYWAWPVIDHVKVAVDPRGHSRVDPQTTLTMLWRNLSSITGKKHK